VLISTPMWNFGIPYKLKQWFDLIVQLAHLPLRSGSGYFRC